MTKKNAIKIEKMKKIFAIERFITTLKNKTYKYMTSVSQNMYIDKLDDIVNEYSNTYHREVNSNKAGLFKGSLSWGRSIWHQASPFL